MISRRPVPRATGFPVFSGSKDCASTAFRDALSRDAAPCRGGCLGALPRGYRQIFYHGGRLCPPRTTSAPCRAGPMCPAAGDAFSGGARGPRPTGRYVEPRVGDGVLPWSAAEQMPLGYDVPSARRCRAARPPLGGGCRRSRLGERKPCGISPSASASRCHLPRRGRQGGSASPCAAGHMGPALRQGTASRSFPSLRHFSS